MRGSIEWFANQMENTLKENDERKGMLGWQECSPYELNQGLQKNVGELALLLVTNTDIEEITKTATDIANYAMMIADKNRVR